MAVDRDDNQQEAANPAAADAAAQITEAMPPTMAGVITNFGAIAVDFPLFLSGKALELQASCGPFTARLRVDPEFAEAICEEIMAAAREARSNISPASMTDVAAVAERAGRVKA